MKKTFENQWQEAFKDVDIPAPEGSWPWIEAELDKKKRRPLLLFWAGSNSFKYAAACLVILGLGLYFYNSPKANVAQVAQTEASGQPAVETTMKQADLISGQPEKISSEKEPKITGNGSNELNNATTIAKKPALAFTDKQTEKSNSKISSASLGLNTERATEEYSLALKNEKISEGQSNNSVDNTEIAKNTAEGFPSETSAIINEVGANPELTYVILQAKSFEAIRVKTVQNMPYLQVDIPENNQSEIAKTSDKMWLGLQSGVSPFNPSYSSQTIAANYFSEVDNSLAYSVKSLAAPSPSGNTTITSVSNPNLPYDEFSNGTSRNVGIEIGKKIRKNWTLATVFRLSNAKINQRTNVFSVDKNSGNVNTFYQTSYLNNSKANDQLFTAIPSDNIQRFRYLQIPVFVAYQYPVTSKLDVEFQTGVSNDVFLGSKISGDIIETSNFTARNSKFKLLNFSGLAGLGLNLKVSRNWRAVVQSNFQKAIFSGTKSELDFRPRFLGVNYGLRYVM